MFRQLAVWNQNRAGGPPPPDAAEQVLALHPATIQRYLEERWAARPLPGQMPALPVPNALVGQVRFSDLENLLGAVADDIYPIGGGGLPTPWPHLVYAFMLEQTGIVEIFRRTAVEGLHGEYLGALSPASQQWLRNVEMLLFSDLTPGSIARVTSTLRPDPEAVRRNAYWRMFGLDLTHGAPDGRPYPYLKAQVANREFVRTFEEFLRETWLAIEHYTNTSGPSPIDPETIARFAQLLQEMLLVRRMNGTLAREEFAAVAALDFLRLTIDFDTPIVVDLQAEATSPDERLRKCGERVGVRSHPKTEAFLDLAGDLTLLLVQIEAGQYSTGANVPALYAPGAPRDLMTRIIAQWSAVTGRDMKARGVTVTPRSAAPGSGVPARPVRRPAPPVPAPPVPAPAPSFAGDGGARRDGARELIGG